MSKTEDKANRACPLRSFNECLQSDCAWWCDHECAAHSVGYLDDTLQFIARTLSGEREAAADADLNLEVER